MKYYVASGITNTERVNIVADALNHRGHTRTYDWTTHGDVSAADDEKKKLVAGTEAQAVKDAELVILLLPGRFFTHADLFISISSAENKRIVLWSENDAPFHADGPFCVFYFHPSVERLVCSFDDLIGYINSNF